MIIEDEIETGKCDYFMSFVKDVIRDLKKCKKSFVFTKEQLDYIKKIYTNIKVDYRDEIFYISI